MRYDARSATGRVLARGLVASLAWALPLSACGEKITKPIIDEGRLVSINISGDSIVHVGDTVRLSTFGRVSGIIGLLTYDRVLDAVWTVSDPAVASVTPIKPPPGDSTSTAAVLVKGLRPGSVQVTATARRVRESVGVRVVPAQ